MSKVPLKKTQWHLSADKQEQRRIINKKRRKKLKKANKIARKTLGDVLNEAIKDIRAIKQ